jgi:CRP-like cAMP-binding protein
MMRGSLANFFLDAGIAAMPIAWEEGSMLSTVEKFAFLKEVPFFRGMTSDQLEALAAACEEEAFAEDTAIFAQGDPGGALYVVVSGRVGIDREKRKGSFVHLAAIGPNSYFGEMSLFDDSPRSTSAVALQDTLTLRLRREPLIELIRHDPGLSLELIKVLSQHLRAANDRIADMTHSRPREINKLYDALES